MRSLRIVILVCAVLSTLGLSACGNEKGHDEDVSMSVPIHMEVPTNDLQPRLGLSGFIFGTFVLLNAYILMIAGCVLLIVKDRSVKQLATLAGLAGGMLDPEWAQTKLMIFLNKLQNHDTRVQYGTAGLIAGVLLAYLGAWIAM
ncbi:MAG: hypothetical protein ABFD81_04565 [Syntrophaceae bacterium]